MRTRLALDDDLLAAAQRLTGMTDPADLVRLGLQALVARESARRLAQLGGSEPAVGDSPRRQSEPG